MAERRDGVRDRNATQETTEACEPCAHAKAHAWWGPTIPAGSTHCMGCHRTWRGETPCHCTICHETFASYFSSDLHDNVRPPGQKTGMGKHVHPTKVAELEPRVRADGGIYWTKRGVSDDG